MKEDALKPAISRRSFLGTTAAACVAVAGAGAGATLAATAAQAAEEGAAAEKWVHGNCRGNCGGMCALKFRVRDGHLVQARPEDVPLENIGTREGCVRGITAPQRAYTPRRLLHPMKRAEGSARGANQWEIISWDEALKTVADQFSSVQSQYGNSAVAFCTGFGSKNWITGTGHVYTTLTQGHTPGTYGVGFERAVQTLGCTLFETGSDVGQLYMQNTSGLSQTWHTANDFVNSDLILIWGCNPTDACRAYWPYIVQAKEQGAKIYCLDPRYSRSASFADVWIPMRPGTDGALMLAIANYAWDNGLVDEDYFANKSNAPLLIKEDGSYLTHADMGLAPYMMYYAQVDMEVPINPACVWDPAASAVGSSYAVADPATEWEGEVTTASGETIKVRTVWKATRDAISEWTLKKAAQECDVDLALITQLAQDYCTANAASVCTYEGLAHHGNSWHNFKNLALMASITGNINKPGASINQYTQGAMNVTGVNPALNKEDHTEPHALPIESNGTQHLPEIALSGTWGGKDWPIKALYVVNSNPLASDSGRTAMIEAFEEIGFVVSAFWMFTDTCLYSDIVLPAASTYETTDLFSAPGGTCLQEACMEPLGEARNDLDIYRGILEAMGHTGVYTKTVEEYLRTALDTDENREKQRDYDSLMSNEGIFHNGGGNFCFTLAEYNPTGRTQFYMENIIPRCNHGQEIPSSYKLPMYEKCFESYEENPLKAQYPFYSVSWHDNYAGHTMFNGIRWLDELREPYVWVHEDAAAERGIAQGDLVKVFNDRGHVVLKCVTTKGIRKDTVLMPHGFQADDYVSGHHQALTSAQTDLVTANNCFYDYLCQVEKWDGTDAQNAPLTTEGGEL